MTARGRWRSALMGCALLASLGPVDVLGQPPPADPPRIDFQAEIRPLLSDRCFRCHGPDPAKRKSKLRLDTREGLLKDLGDGLAVVTPGRPDLSELIRRIEHDDEDERMPPPESHLALTVEEKARLARWVAEGAPSAGHWALEPVRAVPVPERADASPIDAFVRARLARANLAPAPVATPETRLRRLAFTLTGLPPTLADLDAFLADPSPAAWAQAIDRYLASPAYGERMAMDWLDLARYADTYGYQADVERDMSPWRGWVIRAFGDNLPYDQFLTWQLAGDLLPDATPDQRLATAFNRLHRQTNEGGSIEEEFRTEYVLDRVNTLGSAVLGLTVECARCHDHKFDPITQRDYYALAAFFNSIDESGLYSHFTNATPSPSMLLWPAHVQPRYDDLQRRLAATEARLAALADAAGPSLRAWLPTARLEPPTPIAHLTFDSISDDTTPDEILPAAARLMDAPVLVPHVDAATGGALRFSGDNAVAHATVPAFSRDDAFSLAIRLQPTVHQPRAIVVHQSRAWTDAGSRGFELTLEDGRPFFALVHFWPGNAIAVRAREPLPLDTWSRLVVTYDGSSRANGIRLYLDGRRLAVDVVRDRLYKGIGYRATGAEAKPPPIPLTLGARFRDSGFKDGLVDDLQVFDVALTAAEVAGTLVRDPADADALAHFVARHHVPALTEATALAELRAEASRLIEDVPEIMVMEELPTPRPAHVLARGAYDAPGDRVERDTPASLPPFPADAPRNRLGLARWLTTGQHPLTARVAVNRIWRMHFGRGLVATQEDFGNQGAMPSHPGLLDWLAGEFVRSGWDVQALHRLILTSQTYQQASQPTDEQRQRDPDNVLLSRGPRLRLQAEQVRDAALATSGLLVGTVGGPSVKPYQPAGLWEQSGTGKTYVPDTGDKLYRRSLYTFWRRTLPPPSMTLFDSPTREVCTVRREVTTTPLQALVLLNDPQFVEAARVLAERAVAQHPDDLDARLALAFRTLLGRQPDAQERTLLVRTYEEQHALYAAMPAEAAALLGVGARPPAGDLPALDVAATTAVASLLINADEFIVVR